jgi:hypothetical protein
VRALAILKNSEKVTARKPMYAITAGRQSIDRKILGAASSLQKTLKSRPKHVLERPTIFVMISMTFSKSAGKEGWPGDAQRAGLVSRNGGVQWRTLTKAPRAAPSECGVLFRKSRPCRQRQTSVGHTTGVPDVAVSSANNALRRSVTGPALPAPIVRPSTFTTGAISPIVPEQNTSSAR